MIINEFCKNCSHVNVCEWVDKLNKLNGTNKKVGILNITVNSCEAFNEADKSEE